MTGHTERGVALPDAVAQVVGDCADSDAEEEHGEEGCQQKCAEEPHVRWRCRGAGREGGGGGRITLLVTMF